MVAPPSYLVEVLSWRRTPSLEEKGKVKATFGGGRLLGPTFLPEEAQAIDLKEDLGQRPRSKGEKCSRHGSKSQPLIKN